MGWARPWALDQVERVTGIASVVRGLACEWREMAKMTSDDSRRRRARGSRVADGTGHGPGGEPDPPQPHTRRTPPAFPIPFGLCLVRSCACGLTLVQEREPGKSYRIRFEVLPHTHARLISKAVNTSCASSKLLCRTARYRALSSLAPACREASEPATRTHRRVGARVAGRLP